MLLFGAVFLLVIQVSFLHISQYSYQMLAVKAAISLLHLTDKSKKMDTLKRDPIEENLDDLEVSSGSGGKRADTKVHFEACKRS